MSVPYSYELLLTNQYCYPFNTEIGAFEPHDILTYRKENVVFMQLGLTSCKITKGALCDLVEVCGTDISISYTFYSEDFDTEKDRNYTVRAWAVTMLLQIEKCPSYWENESDGSLVLKYRNCTIGQITTFQEPHGMKGNITYYRAWAAIYYGAHWVAYQPSSVHLTLKAAKRWVQSILKFSPPSICTLNFKFDSAL